MNTTTNLSLIGFNKKNTINLNNPQPHPQPDPQPSLPLDPLDPDNQKQHLSPKKQPSCSSQPQPHSYPLPYHHKSQIVDPNPMEIQKTSWAYRGCVAAVIAFILFVGVIWIVKVLRHGGHRIPGRVDVRVIEYQGESVSVIQKSFSPKYKDTQSKLSIQAIQNTIQTLQPLLELSTRIYTTSSPSSPSSASSASSGKYYQMVVPFLQLLRSSATDLSSRFPDKHDAWLSNYNRDPRGNIETLRNDIVRVLGAATRGTNIPVFQIAGVEERTYFGVEYDPKSKLFKLSSPHLLPQSSTPPTPTTKLQTQAQPSTPSPAALALPPPPEYLKILSSVGCSKLKHLLYLHLSALQESSSEFQKLQNEISQNQTSGTWKSALAEHCTWLMGYRYRCTSDGVSMLIGEDKEKESEEILALVVVVKVGN